MLVSDADDDREPQQYRGCLNPCFSGCWSRTATPDELRNGATYVLILVLVDVGLGPMHNTVNKTTMELS